MVLGGSFLLLPLHAEGLSLKEFLNQVSESNREIQISMQKIQAYQQKKSRAELVFAPSAEASLDYSDKKETGFLSFQSAGDKSKSFVSGLELKKEWASGTTTSMSHQFQRYDLQGLSILKGAFWENTLELKIQQDLWKNFGGREKRAEVRQAHFQLDSLVETEKFKIQKKLAEAEDAYWNFVFSRAMTTSVRNSLRRTTAILKWNQKRYRLKLIDQGDLLQSQAKVMEIKQSLETTKTKELAAWRQLQYFISKTFGPIPADLKVDSLSFSFDPVQDLNEWDRTKRHDLQALKDLSKAAKADQIATSSSLDPAVSLVASYGGDSLDSSFSTAERQSFDHSFRKYAIGLNLSLPLDFGKVNNVKASKEKEAEAKEMEYQQAAYQLNREFLDLKDQLKEVYRNIQTAKLLQKTEKKKLNHEEKRFRQGRSTSFQILTFEEDLARAEIDLLRKYSRARSLLTQLRLFIPKI